LSSLTRRGIDNPWNDDDDDDDDDDHGDEDHDHDLDHDHNQHQHTETTGHTLKRLFYAAGRIVQKGLRKAPPLWRSTLSCCALLWCPPVPSRMASTRQVQKTLNICGINFWKTLLVN